MHMVPVFIRSTGILINTNMRASEARGKGQLEALIRTIFWGQSPPRGPDGAPQPAGWPLPGNFDRRVAVLMPVASGTGQAPALIALKKYGAGF
jgi:hypothetical protein